MDRVPRSPIVVVSARWQTRALLAAQLSSTCQCDAVAAPGVDEALVLVRLGVPQPGLIVVDSQEMAPSDVGRLISALPDTPLVLIVSASHRAAFEPLRARSAVLLVRPVTVGQIAEAAAQVLEGKPVP